MTVRWMCRVAMLGVAALVLIAAGCASKPQATEAPEAPASDTPVVMPDLIGHELSDARELLGSHARNVEVVFPARVATRTVMPKVTLGPRESRIETTHYPARRLKLRASVLQHEVAHQDPAPGEPLGPTTTIVLTPGNHPGEAAAPWVYSHVDAVRVDGATPCFDCHDPTGCSDCHIGFE